MQRCLARFHISRKFQDTEQTSLIQVEAKVQRKEHIDLIDLFFIMVEGESVSACDGPRASQIPKGSKGCHGLCRSKHIEFQSDLPDCYSHKPVT